MKSPLIIFLHLSFRFFLTAVLSLALIPSCSPGDRFFAITGYAQGGTYTVKVNMKGENGMVKVSPEKIKNGIDSIITLIDTTLSGYNKNSLLSRFNRGETIVPNEMFMETYSLAMRFYEETEGALDFAAAPLFDAWGFGFTNDTLPTPSQVERLKATCGMVHLAKSLEDVMEPDGTLRPSRVCIDGTTESVRLNYNAFAQGYSCDKVAEYLYGLGVKEMLVDIGEIFCDGLNPNRKPWTIAVDRPVDGNNTPGADIDGIWKSSGGPCGIVTSGNNRKFYIRDGIKYSHTIDPRTGFPVRHNLLSATVTASNATLADAYATYCMVIGLDKSMDFLLSRPDLSGYLISSYPDGSMQEWASPGFNLAQDVL